MFDPLLNMTLDDADIKRKQCPGHGWFQFRTDIIPFKTEDIDIEYNDDPKHNIIKINFHDGRRTPLTLRVPKKGLNLPEKLRPEGQHDLNIPEHLAWYKEQVYKSMAWWREFFTGNREGGVKNTDLMRVWAADVASFGRLVREVFRKDEAASGVLPGPLLIRDPEVPEEGVVERDLRRERLKKERLKRERVKRNIIEVKEGLRKDNIYLKLL